MGLGAKLNFAFWTVIAIAVATHAGLELAINQFIAARSAHEVAHALGSALETQAESIDKHNVDIAGKLASDSAFTAAFTAKDRAAVATAVKAFMEKNGVPGDVCVFQTNGRVFYSTDAPSRFDYQTDRDMADSVHTAVQESRFWTGPGVPTATGQLSIIAMVPIRTGGSNSGALAVCQPLNNQFLDGLKESARLTGRADNTELVLYSLREGNTTAYSSGVINSDGGLVKALDREGLKVMGDKAGFEYGRRHWEVIFRFVNNSHKELARLIAGVSIPDPNRVLLIVAGESAVSLIAAILAAMAFSGMIGGKLDRSMRFLIQRARDIADQKANLPPLDGVSREFLELAEVVDTAIGGTRLSIKNLQGQMGRHQEELLERQKLVDEANSKVEAINRQLSIQSRQLTEVSSQINQANMQAVLLQHKLASVLQISTEGFLILDPYGNILAANPTVLNWLGVQEPEVAGHHCFEIVRKPGQSKTPGQTGTFAVHSGGAGDLINRFFPEGIVYHRHEDKQVEVIAHLQPIMTDEQNIQGYIMALRDKNLHSEAARLRNELVTTLQDAIRTPLAVAEQKWGRVLANAKEAPASQLNGALVDLHLSYQQLLGVVDSFLMMYTGIVPATPVIREQISVARLLGECLERCTDQAREHQVMLDYKTVSGLPTTAVDETLLRDAITQLLERMIHITAAGGRVRVETSFKNNEIRASIFSSGPALPAAEVEDMFAGFIQGKHSEDTYSQRLSMYLVRNNVERLGGRIWAESDRGTYVYLILPIQ